MSSKNTLFFLTVIFLSMISVSSATQADDTDHTTNNSVIRKLESRSYKDILELFNEIGYTYKQWHAGIREVPRIELTNIPERWQKQSRTIPVKEKKNIFFRLIGSGVLIANEKINQDRLRLIENMNKNNTRDNSWLHSLAIRYKVIKNKDDTLDKTKLKMLLRRVDIVPASLALAQGAEESGWGTSRFAVKGNSLFGQWDFSGKGITPEKQRTGLGNYGIAAFDTPQSSVDAYLHNLNTHRAYQRMRTKRAEFRDKSKNPTGWALAETLDKYSERGHGYVKSLHAIMKYNKLAAADDAYLWDKGLILITPAP